MCDYMEKCQYFPEKTIKLYRSFLTKEGVDDSTYNENFIMTNVDGIINKIKLLLENNIFIQEKIYLIIFVNLETIVMNKLIMH